MKKERISIIGAGSWGTTLAVVLSKNGVSVDLHSVFEKHNAAMAKCRQNKEFLPGTAFPAGITVVPRLGQALRNNIIVIAIPVKFVRSVLRRIKREDISSQNKTFISVSKGIESASLKRVSQILVEEIRPANLAVLSGPNIAREVLAGVPSTSLIACRNKKLGQRLQKLFTTRSFRVYLHDDITGVELAGALKNIIALACGISDGLGFGTNTKAALATRGLVEIARLGKKVGANPLTFQGISGLGDLVTTCFSPYSRNRTVGEQIGKGKALSRITKKMVMVAEGLETVKSAYRLSRKLKVDMPITHQVYQVLYRGKNPRKAVSDLMKRPLKEERTA